MYDRSINPGFRFPFERYPSCNLPPGAATRNLRVGSYSYVVTRSRPYLETTRAARGAAPTSTPGVKFEFFELGAGQSE